MHKLFKILALGGVVAFATPALAQVGTVPVPGLVLGFLYKTTYSAAFFGLVPPASATDMVCIAGSATKMVRVAQIRLTGTAGTLTSIPVQIVRRATVDTGGTPASTTANPANTISPRDTTGPTATATLISYTAVPTITDAAPTYVDSAALTLPTVAAATAVPPVLLDYGRDNHALIPSPTLRGATQQLCINFGAASITSGLLNGSITWTEE